MEEEPQLESQDQDQDQQDQEDLEEDWDSTEELPNNQLTGETNVLKLSIHSRPTDSTLDGDKVLSLAHTLWMMLEVPGGKQTSMETCLSPESKYWTELTAVMEESMVLESWLEDTNAVLSETQEKVPGLQLTAEEEETSSRLLEDQDNTFTSVVSEFGDMVEELQLDQDQVNQDHQDQEDLEEDLDSTEELPNNQPTGEMEE